MTCFQIAICDDRESDLSRVHSLLKRYLEDRALRADIDLFSCGEALAISPYIADYDVVLLDVKMPGVNGIDTAYALRKVNGNAILVYISEFADFAQMGYEVQAFRCLTKRH